MRKNSFISQSGANSEKVNIEFISSYLVVGDSISNGITEKLPCAIIFTMTNGNKIDWIYNDNKNDTWFRNDIYKISVLLDHSGDY